MQSCLSESSKTISQSNPDYKQQTQAKGRKFAFPECNRESKPLIACKQQDQYRSRHDEKANGLENSKSPHQTRLTQNTIPDEIPKPTTHRSANARIPKNQAISQLFHQLPPKIGPRS
ncbi:hypothetical protein ACLOJK_035557 [Asimina triloba]